MRLYQISILFLFAFTFCVKAQTIPSKNITINDGLPSNTIRCIYKDNDGRMWLGTDSGVDVFDPMLNQFEINYLNNDFTATELVNDFLEDENNFYSDQSILQRLTRPSKVKLA